jgi:ubiquinone/menaquinone biosynthesis C-methylase UbiE
MSTEMTAGPAGPAGEGFQLDGGGPLAYERYLVPAFFSPCADLLLGRAAAGPGERVLDVACGTGVVARRASGRVGGGGQVVGVDVNPAMIDFAKSVAAVGSAVPARSAVPAGSAAIEWRLGDAAALPLPGGVFDVVCCQQGLQFFTDQPGALAEMRRVLAPGGRLALAVWRSIDHHPAFAAIVRALDRHVGVEAAAMMHAPFSGPDREVLRQLLDDAGYGEISIRIGVLTVRFESARELLRQEVAATPLAALVGAMDGAGRDNLIRDVAEMLRPYLDDDGVAFPMQTWLVTAGHRGQ